MITDFVSVHACETVAKGDADAIDIAEAVPAVIDRHGLIKRCSGYWICGAGPIARLSTLSLIRLFGPALTTQHVPPDEPAVQALKIDRDARRSDRQSDRPFRRLLQQSLMIYLVLGGVV